MSIMREPEKCARRRMQFIAFWCAIQNCLCAGSLLLFSMWAPIFQDSLGFSQMQINAVSIAGALGMYLPVPIFGGICDRFGPAKLSLLSSLFFGPAYLLAAYAFDNKLPFYVMLFAFVLIGCGTSSMYFSGVTTCAKNFTGNNRGIALALPTAAFGLSSLWEAQFVSRMFGGDGGEGTTGGLQLGRAFVFFAGVLTTVGVMGGCGLTILPTVEDVMVADTEAHNGQVVEETTSLLRDVGEGRRLFYGTNEEEVGVLAKQAEGAWLNNKTREFLSDQTMWWFATGVFLATGPGESFFNNMGTLIRSLYPTDSLKAPDIYPLHTQENRIDTATHVSIIALTSTIARLTAGSLSDFLAPTVLVNSPPPDTFASGYQGFRKFLTKKPTMSRMYLIIASAIVMSLDMVFVAMGGVDQRSDRFWIVSSAMGAGYGAVFTLAPTIVSVVWGTENFGTNWGIITVTPAIGTTLFGIIFAMVYDNAARAQQTFASLLGVYYHHDLELLTLSTGDNGVNSNLVCYGRKCFETTYWTMGVSVGLACLCWLWAWRGRGGWVERKINI